jgi:hypothetical protein
LHIQDAKYLITSQLSELQDMLRNEGNTNVFGARGNSGREKIGKRGHIAISTFLALYTHIRLSCNT